MDPKSESYYSISPYAWCANNPVNRIDPSGMADFWNNGKIIGNDGIDDKRILVIRTESIEKKSAKQTKDFIETNTGNPEAFKQNEIAYTNSIEIEPSASNRKAMVEIVSQDNGSGGISEDNNREHGGTIQNGHVVAAPSGPVTSPEKKGAEAYINVPAGFSSFHSHPSGKFYDFPPSGFVNSTFNNNESYDQPPSKEDVDNAGTNTHYVFARGNGNVYIYTSDGVQAIMSVKQFLTPNKKKE